MSEKIIRVVLPAGGGQPNDPETTIDVTIDEFNYLVTRRTIRYEPTSRRRVLMDLGEYHTERDKAEEMAESA